MNEISDYERRIAEALSRIRQAADGLSNAPAGGNQSEEVARLTAQLEDEKLASAQLEERVKKLHDRQTEKVEALEAEGGQRRAAMEGLDAELGRLRSLNDQLRENNAALRAANEQGVGEPHLINKSMLAELESLRAARAADRAEIDAVLAELAQVTSSIEGAA